MPNYWRAFIPGGTYFFTVNLLQRHDNNLLIRELNLLRDTVRRVRKRHPFQIDAWVVLPDHLHCVWTLPSNDSNFSMRWRLIKSGFTRLTKNRTTLWDKRISRRTGNMAAALLETFHSWRFGLWTPYRLRACESFETWIGKTCYRLALLYFSSIRCSGYLFAELGRRYKYFRGQRWITYVRLRYANRTYRANQSQ